MKVSNESNINKSKSNYSQINKTKEDFISFNNEVLNEINYAREKPEEYLLKLEDIKNSLTTKNEKYLYIDDIPYIFQNLFSSLENAISFLKSQKKLDKLICIPKISESCEELKKDLIANVNKKNENKDDNKKFKERIDKYGKTFGENYEIIGYNLLDPEFIVMNLILGDDDSNKLGRKIIFNPDIKYMGITAHFESEKSNNNFHILIFSEDFCEDAKNKETLLNKYKDKNPNYIHKTIFYKTRNEYIDKEDEINLNNKINQIITSSEKYRKKYRIKNSKKSHKHKKNLLENKYKIKNDTYFDYYAMKKDLNLNYEEDELFETEFDNKWGKIEKDKNFHKKIFTTSTTTENGINTTIISEIYENNINGVKKGYFTEQKKFKNYNESWKNENEEKEKRDMTILKDMEKKEKERMDRINKSANKSNLEKSQDSIELPEGVVDIQIKRKNIVDSEGKPAVEIIKSITYEDGSVQNIISRQNADSE